MNTSNPQESDRTSPETSSSKMSRRHRLIDKLRKLVLAHPTIYRILRNTSWLMIERIIDLGIRFFVGAWLVRFLDPSDYGAYSYAISFVALFSVMSTLGLDLTIVREFARAERAAESILATALSLRLVAGIATFGLVTFIVQLSEPESFMRLAILIVAGSLIFQAANVFDLWFQSELLSRYVVWVRTGVTLIFASAQVVSILIQAPLQTFLFLVLMQSGLTGLGLAYCYLRVGPGIRWQVHFPLARQLLRDAWPLLIASVSITVYMKIDQVMLGQMIGNESVGIYGAAVKLSELWYFVPGALATSAFPSLVQLRERMPPESYRERVQRLFDSMALFSYLVISVIVLFGPAIVEVLFGNAYAASAPILQVHIWALIFVAIGTIRSKWLVAENYTRIFMISTAIGALANVGLNLLLIPTFRGLGAAWATLGSYAVAAYFSSLFWKPMRPVFFQQTASLLVLFRLPRLRS